MKKAKDQLPKAPHRKEVKVKTGIRAGFISSQVWGRIQDLNTGQYSAVIHKA